MRKSKDRVSMTCAFVYYARLIGNRGARSPLDIYSCIRGACKGNDLLATDLWAVHECLTVLNVLGQNDIIKTLTYIYVEPFLSKPLRRFKSKELSARILRFAHENYLDERTVYRRLSKARNLWQSIRILGTYKK